MTGTLTLFCVLLVSNVLLSEGNWYGKRGSEVDDAFQRYLEGRLTKSISTQSTEDRDTLYKISKLLKEWQLKTKTNEAVETGAFDQK